MCAPSDENVFTNENKKNKTMIVLNYLYEINQHGKSAPPPLL